MSADEENMRKFSQSVHGLLAPGDSEDERENSRPGIYVAKEGANPPQSDESNMADFVRNLFDVPN